MSQQPLPDGVLDFINNNRLTVLSTVSSNNAPEAALVYYAWDQLHIYCCTYKKSRKIQNIESNNKVALVMGQEVKAIVLQLEGTARIISDKTQKTNIMALYAKSATANPDSVYFPPLLSLSADSPMEFLEITIEWFKFSIFESHFPIIVEGKPSQWTERS